MTKGDGECMDPVATPPPQSSAPPSGSSSLVAGVARFLNQLPGLASTLFAMRILDNWFRSLPNGDPLRQQILWGLLIAAVPVLASIGWSLLRQRLNDRTSNKSPS